MARMAGGAEPTIGIVGPHELVERIMLSGLPLTAGTGSPQSSDRGDTATRRLVTAAYREEQEAPEKVAPGYLYPAQRQRPVRGDAPREPGWP
jgi:hypothetical protein